MTYLLIKGQQPQNSQADIVEEVLNKNQDIIVTAQKTYLEEISSFKPIDQQFQNDDYPFGQVSCLTNKCLLK